LLKVVRELLLVGISCVDGVMVPYLPLPPALAAWKIHCSPLLAAAFEASRHNPSSTDVVVLPALSLYPAGRLVASQAGRAPADRRKMHPRLSINMCLMNAL
jgi:hypothetical protein